MHKLLYPSTVFLLAGSLFAADPFAGNWKLNVAKSTFEGPLGPAPKEATLVREDQGDQWVDTGKAVLADGSPISLKLTVTKTGGELKRLGEGPAQLQALEEGLGSGGVLAKRKADSRSAYFKLRLGKIDIAEHDEVSKDGKTLTVTEEGTDNRGKHWRRVEVFDRQ
jgi:hypothetical protein